MASKNYKGYTNFRQRDHLSKNILAHSRPKRFKSSLDRDFLAMKQVWEMLKTGTIRWFGEIGRQY